MDDRDDGTGDGRLTFLDRPLPAAFELRLVALDPGGDRPYDAAEWRGALVVVERGEVELEANSGRCWTFKAGSVLWLVGLPLRALHNRGAEQTVLSAVTRRPT
jgi:hypothetical protein